MIKVPMQTMYEVMKLSHFCKVPEEEILLCLFEQGFELSYVANTKANYLRFGL